MKKKMANGFILLEVIIGIFFMGILSTTYLPILASSLNNYNRVQDRSEMYYIGEMVVEKLKTSSEHIKEIIAELDTYGEIDYVDEDFDTQKYSCKIIKTNNNEGILEFIVKVKINSQENSYYVEYKASIPKK